MKTLLPRSNANYNATRDPSYYEYSSYAIQPGKIDLYTISSHLGRGKYSEVFLGRCNEKKIVIKVLRPIKISKINREILVMKNLDHQNIIKLRDVVQDRASGVYSLIFNYIEHKDSMDILNGAKMNLGTLKWYMKQLLEALEHAHSRGIMHRDVKPHNMVISSDKRLILIDWGLAEFFHPGQEYSTRVASRYYKSPELLLDYPFYDYSLDIWSFGCVLAEIVFEKRPFFYGSSTNDQFLQIVKVLGKKDLIEYTKKYEIVNKINISSEMPAERVALRTLMPENKFLIFEDAVDLLEKILIYDHNERPTATECLKHKFFN